MADTVRDLRPRRSADADEEYIEISPDGREIKVSLGAFEALTAERGLTSEQRREGGRNAAQIRRRNKIDSGEDAKLRDAIRESLRRHPELRRKDGTWNIRGIAATSELRPLRRLNGGHPATAINALAARIRRLLESR